MPRSKGMDAVQRSSSSRGGIFTLSTPFQRSMTAQVASNPRDDNNHTSRDDDMEFHSTQTQPDAAAKNRGDRQQQQTEQFKDGMAEEEDDSDATTLDDDDQSVDLLADSQEGDNNGNKRNNRAASSLLSSPISPATQTLNRLSKFGSQEGGAELCIHLLNDNANTATAPAGAAAAENNGAGRELERGGESCDDRIDKSKCLRELKEYFMSTSNSSINALARSDMQPPTVPFCHKCSNASTAGGASQQQQSQSSMISSLPHHGLCPQHPDFYNSGSYEILNLVVDGNILGCEACIHQFDMGRPNKKLEHGNGCQRAATKKGGSGGGGTTRGQKKRVADNDSDGNRKQSAQLSTSIVASPMRSTRASSSPMRSTGLGDSTGGSQSANIHGPIEVGAVVFVQDRTWPGMNDPGGVARVIKVHTDDDDASMKRTRCYDVAYVIERRRANGVEEKYVTLHTDYVSPSKDMSGGFLAGENDDDDEEEEEDDSSDDEESEDEGNVAAAGNQAPAVDEEEEIPEFDEHGHPLSEYERLRRKNIRRNEARLRQLGLLAPPKTGNNDNDGSRRRGGGKAKMKKKQQQQPGERRIQPKRQMAKQAEGDDDGKPQAALSHVAQQKFLTATGEEVTLADGAKSGCKKCIAELQTGEKPPCIKHDSTCPLSKSKRASLDEGGEKTNKEHDNVCPRSKSKRASLDEGATSGCRKCKRELDTGKKDIHRHDDFCPRKRGASTNRSNPAAAEEDEGQQQPSKQLPAARSDKAPTLMDAAKAGCRKCTLEWQTEEVDPTMNHDICCPRSGKKAPPPAEQPSRRREEGLVNSISLASSSTSRANDTSTRAIKASKITPSRASHHQPSPAPLLLAQQPKKNKKKNPPLPAWIKEFIKQSNRHNETVPAPRGSKWLPCPNPWGKIGHEEGDFVIISPFQSESAGDMLSIFHMGPNGGIPKRFVANPFEDGSPYHDTHRGPARGGYSVLRVRRDTMGLRPWGFTVRLHEFGGACLVDSIEPLSPAEAAQDISGWSGGSSSSGLNLHDMIICINGKSSGTMTMPELQIELDVCGPELMLVVSRFDIHESIAGGAGQTSSLTLEDMAMDWNDIGAGAPVRRKRVFFEDEARHESDDFELEGAQHGNEVTPPPSARGENSEPSLKQQASMPTPTNRGGSKHSTSLSGAAKSGSSEMTHKRKRHLETTPKAPRHSTMLAKDMKKEMYVRIDWRDTKTKEHIKSIQWSKQHKSFSCLSTMTYTIERGDRNDVAFIEYANKVAQFLNAMSDEQLKALSKDQMIERLRRANLVGSASVPTVTRNTGSIALQQGAKAGSRYQRQLEELSDDESDISPKRAPRKKSKIDYRVRDEDDLSCSSVENEYQGEGDENPWLGCVCGKTHPHPIKVFWVQCEGCDSWHNVAQECVGFDSKTAETLEEWFCWACRPPVAGLGL